MEEAEQDAEGVLLFIRNTLRGSNDVPTDVVFVVDSSTSVTDSHFESIRSILLRWIEFLPHDNTRVGLVLFATETNIVVDFNADFSEVMTAVKEMKRMHGTTNLHHAVHVAAGMLATGNSRQNAAKLLICMTDGEPTIRTITVQSMQTLRQAMADYSFSMFGIGVGDVKEASLVELFGQEYTLKVNDYATIQETISAMSPYALVPESNVVISVRFRQRSPVQFSDPLPLRITVENRSLTKPIDSNSRLVIRGSKCYYDGQRFLNEPIDVESSLDLDMDLNPQASASIQTFPEVFEVLLIHPNGLHYKLENHLIQIPTYLLSGSLWQWRPQKLVEDRVRILVTGLVGGGKSTLIQNLLSLLSPEKYEAVIARPQTTHVTKKLEYHTQLDTYNRLSFALLDSPGFDLDGKRYGHRELEAIVNGQIPFASFKLIPDDDVDEATYLQQLEATIQAEKTLPENCSKRLVHAAIVVLPEDLRGFSADKVHIVRTRIDELHEAGNGLKLCVLVSRMDKSNSSVAQVKRDFAQITGLDEADIFPMDNRPFAETDSNSTIGLIRQRVSFLSHALKRAQDTILRRATIHGVRNAFERPKKLFEFEAQLVDVETREPKGFPEAIYATTQENQNNTSRCITPKTNVQIIAEMIASTIRRPVEQLSLYDAQGNPTVADLWRVLDVVTIFGWPRQPEESLTIRYSVADHDSKSRLLDFDILPVDRNDPQCSPTSTQIQNLAVRLAPKSLVWLLVQRLANQLRVSPTVVFIWSNPSDPSLLPRPLEPIQYTLPVYQVFGWPIPQNTLLFYSVGTEPRYVDSLTLVNIDTNQETRVSQIPITPTISIHELDQFVSTALNRPEMSMIFFDSQQSPINRANYHYTFQQVFGWSFDPMANPIRLSVRMLANPMPTRSGLPTQSSRLQIITTTGSQRQGELTSTQKATEIIYEPLIRRLPPGIVQHVLDMLHNMQQDTISPFLAGECNGWSTPLFLSLFETILRFGIATMLEFSADENGNLSWWLVAAMEQCDLTDDQEAMESYLKEICNTRLELRSLFADHQYKPSLPDESGRLIPAPIELSLALSPAPNLTNTPEDLDSVRQPPVCVGIAQHGQVSLRSNQSSASPLTRCSLRFNNQANEWQLQFGSRNLALVPVSANSFELQLVETSPIPAGRTLAPKTGVRLLPQPSHFQGDQQEETAVVDPLQVHFLIQIGKQYLHADNQDGLLTFTENRSQAGAFKFFHAPSLTTTDRQFLRICHHSHTLFLSAPSTTNAPVRVSSSSTENEQFVLVPGVIFGTCSIYRVCARDGDLCLTFPPADSTDDIILQSTNNPSRSLMSLFRMPVDHGSSIEPVDVNWFIRSLNHELLSQYIFLIGSYESPRRWLGVTEGLDSTKMVSSEYDIAAYWSFLLV